MPGHSAEISLFERRDPAPRRRPGVSRKLDPRGLVAQPGDLRHRASTSLLVTLLVMRDRASPATDRSFIGLQVAMWLWFTVLFANFAEAIAEGRGKARADALRAPRVDDPRQGAARPSAPRDLRSLLEPRSCVEATSCSSRPAISIPSDGEVIEGVASVDESAITGEIARPSSVSPAATAPRSPAAPRCCPTGCTVRSHGRARRDLPRPHDRAGRRRQARRRPPTRSPSTSCSSGLTLGVPGRRRDAAGASPATRGTAIFGHGPRRRCSITLIPTTMAGCCRPSASPAWTGWCSCNVIAKSGPRRGGRR